MHVEGVGATRRAGGGGEGDFDRRVGWEGIDATRG